jgi:hypothetical protein
MASDGDKSLHAHIYGREKEAEEKESALRMKNSKDEKAARCAHRNKCRLGAHPPAEQQIQFPYRAARREFLSAAAEWPLPLITPSAVKTPITGSWACFMRCLYSAAGARWLVEHKNTYTHTHEGMRAKQYLAPCSSKVVSAERRHRSVAAAAGVTLIPRRPLLMYMGCRPHSS